MYPPLSARNGKQGRTVIEGPVGCIRMEMLRDGIEDYEYFAILKRLSPSNPLLQVPDSVTSSMTEFAFDSSFMESHRLRIAREIERLSSSR